MDEGATSRHDDGEQARPLDFDARSELLGALALQAEVRATCLDASMAFCALTPEILALGLQALVLDDADGETSPIELVRGPDEPIVLDAFKRARAHGAADAVVLRSGDEEDLVVHVVNMLDEWGVIVVLVGGTLRPLLGRHAGRAHRQLPRRLVHHRDRHGQMMWVDDATELLLGWSPAAMVGQSALRFVDAADHERAIAGWIDMLAGRKLERNRFRYLTAAGGHRWLESTLTKPPAGAEHDHVEVELIDVHDEMMALSAAKFGAAQFDALIESIPAGVIQVGADGEIGYVNRWIRELTGFMDQGATCRDGIVADDLHIVDHAFASALSHGRATNVEVRLIRASDGQHRHCRLRVRPLGLDEDGRSQGAISSVEDVTETMELHARLNAQIRTDVLTGVSNRLALDEWLAAQLADGVDGGVTLFYLDLDGFKHVNDRLGHEAGDRLLRAISSAMELTVEPRDLVARIGGDEFVIARPRLIDDDQCARFAQRLLDSVGHDIDVGEATTNVGCSIGIARSDVRHGGPIVLADADEAMYDAKRSGGRRWAVCSSTALSVLAGGDTTVATRCPKGPPLRTPLPVPPIDV